MYELTKEQVELLKNMIVYCVKKFDGVKSKVGDRAIFIHILKSCLNESLKGIVDMSAIGVAPVRINEILITAYGNEIALLQLKTEKGESYIDTKDLEYTIQWLL